jgi:hypothetical protein
METVSYKTFRQTVFCQQTFRQPTFRQKLVDFFDVDDELVLKDFRAVVSMKIFFNVEITSTNSTFDVQRSIFVGLSGMNFVKVSFPHRLAPLFGERSFKIIENLNLSSWSCSFKRVKKYIFVSFQNVTIWLLGSNCQSSKSHLIL